MRHTHKRRSVSLRRNNTLIRVQESRSMTSEGLAQPGVEPGPCCLYTSCANKRHWSAFSRQRTPSLPGFTLQDQAVHDEGRHHSLAALDSAALTSAGLMCSNALEFHLNFRPSRRPQRADGKRPPSERNEQRGKNIEGSSNVKTSMGHSSCVDAKIKPLFRKTFHFFDVVIDSYFSFAKERRWFNGVCFSAVG